MEWKKQVLTIGATAAALLAMSSVAASANEASGSCSAKGHNGNAWTVWHNKGTTNYVTSFNFKISGKGTGGKSDVSVVHYENRTAGKDRQLWAGSSNDNVKQDEERTLKPSRPIALDFTKEMHTDYTFAFDVFGPDPTCKARTSDFG